MRTGAAARSRPGVSLLAALLLATWAACGPCSAGRRGRPAPALDRAVVNEPGEMVAVEDILVPGKVTLVDFWAVWCKACKTLDAELERGLAGVAGVAVRRIDIRDASSPVAHGYDIGVLPHVRIYDRTGRLVYVLIGDNTERTVELTLAVLRGE